MDAVQKAQALTPHELDSPGTFLRVDAATRHVLPSWHELWQYREMLYFLVWQIPSNGIPYPLFSFAALVPWTFFSNGVALAVESLVGQAHLLKKIYFPRLYLPLARVLSGLTDYCLALLVLFVLMIFYSFFVPVFAFSRTQSPLQIPLAVTYIPSLSSIVPLLLLSALMVIVTFGVSIWVAALNIKYRDIRYLIPYLLQVMLFLTPIAYPSSLIQEPGRTLYSLNPMVTVVDGLRWALLGLQAPSGLSVALSLCVTASFLLSGLIFFGRTEDTFSDFI